MFRSLNTASARCSMGLPCTSNMHLGTSWDKGSMREPSPAAIMTAIVSVASNRFAPRRSKDSPCLCYVCAIGEG